MTPKDKMRRARVMLYAQDYRLQYYSDEESFAPMEHVEHVLQMRPNIRVVFRDEISEAGLGIEARVKFFKSGAQLLEITERAGRGAACGLPMARFAIAHEIGHINLHRQLMRTKIEGAARNYAPTQVSQRSRLHHETQAMESEADIYGGLLLVPLSKIDKDADYVELAKQYNAPPIRVRQLRWDVMEVWSTLLKLKGDRRR